MDGGDGGDRDGTGGHSGHWHDGVMVGGESGFWGGSSDGDHGAGIRVSCDCSDHTSTGGYDHRVGGDLVMVVGLCVPWLWWS